MIDKKLTVLDILRMGPCEEYSKDIIKKLWAGNDSLTLLEILDLNIPARDRLWVILGDDLLEVDLCRLFACDCAERVLSIFEAEHDGDNRPREAINIARRYIHGDATISEIYTAHTAAAFAAAEAALSSSYSAAAAHTAAFSVLYAARASTTSSPAATAAAAALYAHTAASAVSSTDRDEERNWQAARLKELIKQ